MVPLMDSLCRDQARVQVYRADIDGLRALAVLSVIFHHYLVPGFRGFVGVDVFFVISGFLIAAHIESDIAAGRFSRLDLDTELRISRAAYEAQQHSAAAIFARLQERYRFRSLKPQDCLCADGMCSIARDGAPLYIDGEHLSELGAMISEPALEAIWDDKVASKCFGCVCHE